jgi:hypothetical protein
MICKMNAKRQVLVVTRISRSHDTQGLRFDDLERNACAKRSFGGPALNAPGQSHRGLW